MTYNQQINPFVIEPDGLTSTRQRDPPGQFSVYIPSGDTWNERYRLSTFSQFNNTAVIPSQLAASGFYYTGFKDRVKCFSCALNVENWIQGDNPTDKRWHQGNCDFANGRDTSNKPIRGAFTNLRLTSSLLQTTSISAGSSALSTSPNSTVISGGNYVQRNVPLSYNSTEGSRHLRTNNVNFQNHNNGSTSQRHSYACESPLNPHMTSSIRRSESFKPRNGIRWPAEKVRASVDELVNAGFFFLGERDRVKCFYCNGGLQNWEYEDDPWTEHAKWFPSCEYALRVKGPAYVQNIVNQFPNINRPTPTRTNPRSLNRPGGDIPPALSTTEAVGQAMLNLPYVENALRMGFETEAIKSVLTSKYEADSDFYRTAEEFIEALFLHPNNANMAQ